MNTENVLKTARKVFTNLNQVNENLYKGELKISSDRPAGVYFLDFNYHPSRDNFNDYQEKILAKEYYSNPGDLQWNYYLLMFQDEINETEKREIETNNKYARKYIFSENDFTDFFKLEASSSEIKTDIVSEWKKYLDQVDLQEVYSEEPLAPAVRRFYDNNTKKIKKALRKETANTDLLSINFINRITLNNNFRKYPLEPRTFEFRKVNLIRGINGVGKTSLLEAIELIVCGKTLRNEKILEENNCVEALINGNITERCTPAQNEKYRLRDLRWYSRNYPKDNSIHYSFNRYNFFNSDAAYDFSSSSNEKEINDALFNLVLGQEYNHIAERSAKFYDQISPELNRLTKDMDNQVKLKTQNNLLLKNKSQSSKIKSLEAAILENLNQLKTKNVNLKLNEQYSEIEALRNQIQAIIEKIRESKILNIFSKGEVIEKERDLKRRIILFNDFEPAVLGLNNFIQLYQNEVSLLANNLEIYSRCLKYFRNAKFFTLENFDKRLNFSNENISKLRLLENIINNIDIKQYQSQEIIGKLLLEKNLELSNLKTQLDDFDKRLKKLLSKLNESDKVIKEIKLLGKEFIALNPNSSSCPLCQSKYDTIELHKRINELTVIPTSNNTLEIETLHENQQNSNKAIENITQYINNLNTIKSAYLIFEDDVESKSLDDVLKFIESKKNEKVKANLLNQELIELRQMADALNVSESEFIYLKNRLEEINAQISFIYENKNLFEKKESDIAIEIENKKMEIEGNKAKHQKLINEIKHSLNLDDDKLFSVDQIKQLLLKEETEIKNLIIYFDRLYDLIEVKDDNPIAAIELILSILSKNLDSHRIELKNQFEVEALKKGIIDANAFIDNNQEKYKRLKAAKEVLVSLSSIEGNEQLRLFFSENLKEIIDIFKTIHLPKEFKDIVFEENELQLTTVENEKRKISQISTGQRSALALSIFISLNRKLKIGPNIIMFDDPVSFIDDLNALSFLDFLRYFVLKEGKQIFFSTANIRLASLFEKKFNFLDADFRKWELNRVS
jgi:exonuclease SbcC